MEKSETIISRRRRPNEDFISLLRENPSKFFPSPESVIDGRGVKNQKELYMNIYRTLLLFGWQITRTGLVKVKAERPPFDLALRILDSLVALQEDYFSSLFILTLCQDIFDYGFKKGVAWDVFSSWLQTQNYISPNLEFVKYRWDITHTYTRKEIGKKISNIALSKAPEWKKCLIEEAVGSYKALLPETENYPEIQVAFPVLKFQGLGQEKEIMQILREGEYDRLKKIGVTYKKEMYNFGRGDWWVDFASANLGGGALGAGFVQEEILAVKFPELLYFSNQGYKIPHNGAIVMTNLLRSLNLPDSWYGRKGISGKSCWDIISGVEKATAVELKNFIAVAAVDHSRGGQRPFNRYGEKELVLVFNRCYSGFMMAKILGAQTVNSGPLGSGVFNNSPVFMYTLQILAASAVGIDINFWGTGYQNEISLKRAMEMIEGRRVLELLAPILPFRGLLNLGSSCYMDSVLFSLLYPKLPVLQEKILQKKVEGPVKGLQEELVRIQRSIQGTGEVDTCADFRLLLRNIPPRGPTFAGVEEHDAGEFYMFLMEIFDVTGAVVKTTTYGTNDAGERPPLTVTSTRTDARSSLVNFIDSFALAEAPANYFLSNFLLKRTDVYPDDPLRFNGQTFVRKLTKEEVLSVPDFYSFFVQRADPITNRVLVKPIHPNEAMKIGDKVLKLYAVVIHVGSIDSGHYLVYFKYQPPGSQEPLWYKYNDVTLQIRRIGSFHDMLNYDPDPTKRGIIYFYNK